MSRHVMSHLLTCTALLLPLLTQMSSSVVAQESFDPIYTGSPLQLATEAKIRLELDEPTIIDFIDTPLEDVLNYLEDYHVIEIELDQNALELRGIDSGTPVNRNLSDLSLRSALSHILSGLDLTHLVEDEVLLITSTDMARTHLRTVVYPVVDFFTANDDPQEKGEELIAVLKALVSPSKSSNPIGKFAMFGNHLIIQQPEAAHEEIQKVLDALRRASY